MITEIKSFATHDGPGIRTTVFCKGCPLHCRWCANPETISPREQLYFIANRCKSHGFCADICPEKAIRLGNETQLDRNACTECMACVNICPTEAFRQVGSHMAVEDVLQKLERDRPFFGDDGGLTLSGGEPLLQPEFSISLLRRSKMRGFTTVLDTCGYAPTEVVEQAVKHTDLVLLDIKHMDPGQHRRGTGKDNGFILKNAMYMARTTTVRISLPLIHGFNDSEKNLCETAAFALALDVTHIDINPMHCLGSDKYRSLGLEPPYDGLVSPTPEQTRQAVELIRSYGLKTTVGRMM